MSVSPFQSNSTPQMSLRTPSPSIEGEDHVRRRWSASLLSPSLSPAPSPSRVLMAVVEDKQPSKSLELSGEPHFPPPRDAPH